MSSNGEADEDYLNALRVFSRLGSGARAREASGSFEVVLVSESMISRLRFAREVTLGEQAPSCTQRR